MIKYNYTVKIETSKKINIDIIQDEICHLISEDCGEVAVVVLKDDNVDQNNNH